MQPKICTTNAKVRGTENRKKLIFTTNSRLYNQERAVQKTGLPALPAEATTTLPTGPLERPTVFGETRTAQCPHTEAFRLALWSLKKYIVAAYNDMLKY